MFVSFPPPCILLIHFFIEMDQQVSVSVSIVHIFIVYSSDATCSLKAMSIDYCSLSMYPSYYIIE